MASCRSARLFQRVGRVEAFRTAMLDAIGMMHPYDREKRFRTVFEFVNEAVQHVTSAVPHVFGNATDVNQKGDPTSGSDLHPRIPRRNRELILSARTAGTCREAGDIVARRMTELLLEAGCKMRRRAEAHRVSDL